MKRDLNTIALWFFPILALLDLVLVGMILLRAPLLLKGPYIGTALTTMILLVVYGIVGAGFPRLLRSVEMQKALWQATRIGLLIGLLFIGDITVESFIDLSQSASTTAVLAFMASIFLSFAIAGIVGTRITKKFLPGLICSVWSTLPGVLIALLYGMAVNLLFLPRMEAISVADFIQSGMSDPVAASFFNTLDNASTHLFEAPIYAAILGTLAALGTLLFTRLISRQQN